MKREKGVIITRGSTLDNAENLSKAAMEELLARYENTRIGQQELYAELLMESEKALWSREVLDATRMKEYEGDFKRIVVAVDPSVEEKKDSDEMGIIVAGLNEDNHGCILADYSGHYTVGGVCKKLSRVYRDWMADLVVAEVNNGGAWIGHALQKEDSRVAYKAVRASRGKYARAEPIAAFFEQGRAHMIGHFSEAEEELVTWEPDANKPSPNRLDAIVWALTELMLGSQEIRQIDLVEG